METHALIFLLLTIFATSCLCELTCYDCDPINATPEACKHPKDNLVVNSNCKAQPNTTTLCMSAYVKDTANANNSGIYRGCVNKPIDVNDACDWLKENSNLTYMSCQVCNEHLCNQILLNPDGSSSSNSIYNYSFMLCMALMGVFRLLR
ncbi:unnamed protein product [Phyllotreta striolata]|uniref:Protein quiver n=1 Tax=Phyllotreta striolata TaxID=444603 RepID=A0A9N9XUW9_PHYSR|nr:unnamed protein product [Phyllotreta striolata]